MADAAIIKVVLGTVISVASDPIALVRGFDKELQSLRGNAEIMWGFLADAEGKMKLRLLQLEAVKPWLLQLEAEAFKAENVLDELRYENLRQEVEYRNQFKKLLCFFFSLCNIGFRYRLASKIRDINANFDKIIGQGNNLGLVTRIQIEAALPADADRATTSRPQTDSVRFPNAVGRAEDEEKIVKTLLGPSERPLSLLPIIGTGGLGKTTLAKSVYNSPQIDGHFKKRIWVCVAKEIKIMDLFKFILESTGEKVEVNQRNVIVQKIQQALGRERYFIVLDDVWNHEQGLWEDFLHTLEGLNPTNGSWCLVTTRLREMAETVSKHLSMKFDPSFLKKLTGDECWSIIRNKVVVAGEEVPKELEAIREQILRRCDGLPLAASLIGGLLRCKEKEEWGSIVDKSLFDGDHQNHTTQIVKVSFDHLSPAPVKKCFAYCSIFPEDTKLDKDILIELWMAEGFLPQDGKNESMMEKIGDTYFRILLQCSLLEENGSYYKMHDIVHDFAKSVLNPKRYPALNSYEEMAGDIVKNISPSVRTLFLESEISHGMLLKLEYLHVLKLSGDNVKTLPASIGALKHLRFLDISESIIEILPKSLYKLYSLQTLSIHVDRLSGLPKRLSNLISLRHLHIEKYSSNISGFEMPLGMGRLTCLVTLKFFNVGQEKGRRIEELGNLKNLKGSLLIGNLERVNGKEGAQLAKLFGKPYLSRLEFKWGREEDSEADAYDGDDDVLEGLQPHENLQELVIENFMGFQFPQWLLNLSKLGDLELTNCKRCTQLPELGKLPSLRRLFCDGLENIRCIGLSFYGIDEGGSRSTVSGRVFPALKKLSLYDMENLVEWKDVEEEEVDLFPMLKELTILNCKRLTQLPALGKLPSLRSLYCDGLENIRCIGLSFYGIDEGGSRSTVSGRVFPALEELSLIGMENLVEWKDVEEEEVDVFPMLKELAIQNCKRCTQLPALGKLPSLQTLHCSLLKNIRCIGLSFYGIDEGGSRSTVSGRVFPALEKLSLIGMENLVEWKDVEEEEVDFFPMLKELEIRNCKRLTQLPALGKLPSLRSLTYFGLENIRCFGLSFYGIDEGGSRSTVSGRVFPALEKLSLIGMENLVEWKDVEEEKVDFFPMLKELTIRYCSQLTTAPSIYRFQALGFVEILECPRINTIEEEENGNAVVFQVDLHCSGCAFVFTERSRGFLGFQAGVETVTVRKVGSSGMLTVTGKVDPVKLLEKLEEKTHHGGTHQKVELFLPAPKKDKEKAKSKNDDAAEGKVEKKNDSSKDTNNAKKNNQNNSKEIFQNLKQ